MVKLDGGCEVDLREVVPGISVESEFSNFNEGVLGVRPDLTDVKDQKRRRIMLGTLVRSKGLNSQFSASSKVITYS